MTTRFRVPPGCKGLDFQFGGGLNANRRGIVEVPDALAGTVKRGTDGVACEPLIAFSDSACAGKERMCDGCGFSMWAWTIECPRCHHQHEPLPKETEHDAVRS